MKSPSAGSWQGHIFIQARSRPVRHNGSGESPRARNSWWAARIREDEERNPLGCSFSAPNRGWTIVAAIGNDSHIAELASPAISEVRHRDGLPARDRDADTSIVQSHNIMSQHPIRLPIAQAHALDCGTALALSDEACNPGARSRIIPLLRVGVSIPTHDTFSHHKPGRSHKARNTVSVDMSVSATTFTEFGEVVENST